MRPVIIDTDIGTDIDDAFALIYATKRNYDIKLVTTVHGDTVLRAGIAKKILGILGKDLPVFAGERQAIKQKQIYWGGHEGGGFIETKDLARIEKGGVEAIIKTIDANPGIDVVCIGPLTNIAKAFTQCVGLEKKVNTLYIMGNAITTPDNFYLNYRAHNFKVDPEAVDIIFEKDVRKVIVTTEVAKKTYITKLELARMQNQGEALRYLGRDGFTWLEKAGYPHTFMYDPLTMALVEDENIIKTKKYNGVEVSQDLNKDFMNMFKERMGI